MSKNYPLIPERTLNLLRESALVVDVKVANLPDLYVTSV